MEKLLLKSNRKIEAVDLSFQRFLLSEDIFKHRLIAIKGARGTGKTTLLLQYAKKYLPFNPSVLYFAMDDLFFTRNTLYSLAEQFVLNNGKYLLIDEVHKYPDWSRELKLIYDDFSNLQIVFTSSSVLNIYKGESDLSRRAVTYELPELSLREFIGLESQIKLPVFSLEEILKNHQQVAFELIKSIKPVFEFNKYIKYGQYPYFIEGLDTYQSKIMHTIQLILDVDLAATENIDYNHIVKLKKLLYAIATSVPFTPNISKLSEKVELSRPFMIKALELLEKAHLLLQLQQSNKGISQLSKPEKLYLRNTNLLYAIAEENTNTGNLRETFFINQLAYKHNITLPKTGDFLVNDSITFEIGGKNKSRKQIEPLANAFIVKDGIETGINQTIPLWLFGFLY
ncbi:MAG: ATP-binding protein [Salinivirgaceae bacterium]